jgi:coenzyme F420-reducing hydrogenase delta subunit/Pyruvate/2-oxoacid:ferredoxin oxidoreductase delta subunit
LNHKTLILGNGPCAGAVAENFLTAGAKIIIATRDDTCNFDGSGDTGALQIMTQTRLISCKGSVGNFRIRGAQKNEPVTIHVGRIIIAEEGQRTSNFSLYGLNASSRVMTLSQMKKLLNRSSNEISVLSEIKKVVFLTGIARESTPIIAKEVMLSSLLLQKDFNLQTYILTKNLKVAGDGLESLYQGTKNEGTIYVKFTDAVPDIHQKEDDPIRIEFFDEITSKNFRLTPDMTVVDETIVPSRYAIDLGEIFDIEKDVNGFVQADNVHRYPVLTNRKGIMIAGPSRGIMDFDDQRIDAGNAALAITDLSSDETKAKAEKAQVHEGQCIRCLTCYRLCPYHAITLNSRVTVVPDACERCGICAAHCPRHAVRITDLEPEVISELITTGCGIKKQKSFVPFIVAFCCRRSAAQAEDLAICMGHRLPQGLRVVEVPCSGALSYGHIFSALENNADGVMVLTCHKGNCHSEHGNLYADQTVKQIRELFSRIGFEKERLLIETLASNMGAEFARISGGFEETIIKLGPSRLKK